MNISLAKNFASLMTAEALSKLLTFACFAYIARRFGPSGYGMIEWAGTALLCAGLIIDQGFNSYGAREIAKDPSATHQLVEEIISARFLLAALAFVAVLIFATLLVAEGPIATLLIVYGASLWFLPLHLQWVFQGHDRMHVVGAIQMLRQVIFAAAVFALVAGVNDLMWVAVAEISGVTAAALFSIWMYYRYFGLMPKRPRLTAHLFREATPIGLSQMFWVLKMFGATFIVGLIASAEETGYFAGAMRIYIALHTFVWLYFFNMLPSMSRAWAIGSEALGGMITQSLWLVTVVSLFVGLVWVVAAPAVMARVYGDSFLPGAAALQWLAGACIAAAFSGHFRYALIAAGRQGKELIAMATGSVSALVLIPVFYSKNGIAGAAGALFAAECVVLALSIILAKQYLFSGHKNTLSAKDASLNSLPEAMQ